MTNHSMSHHSHARVEEGPNRQTDEFGNPLPQPTTTATNGAPSSAQAEGGAAAIFGDDMTAYYGGQPQKLPREPPKTDPTQRRGPTTGEYGEMAKDGVGLMDMGKDKLDEMGGFKEDPGHIETHGDHLRKKA